MTSNYDRGAVAETFRTKAAGMRERARAQRIEALRQRRDAGLLAELNDETVRRGRAIMRDLERRPDPWAQAARHAR